MPDICKCLGVAIAKEVGYEVLCPVRNDCYRYTAEPSKHWQAYSNFYKEGKDCSMFISNKDK